MSSAPANALVIGGSGHLGSAVVRELAGRGMRVTFTYCAGEDRAAALAKATGARSARLDLAAATTDADLAALAGQGSWDHMVHCAGVLGPADLASSSAEDARRTWALGPGGALAAMRAARPKASAVFVSALDRGQSLPLPPAFAAAQGGLGALAMALAKELGPSGVRVNAVALGPLDGGLAAALPARLVEDYTTFSALRRVGTAEEAARAIAWLLADAAFVTGRVLAANGGI
jgi:3-oxoacyl-[acyl-carrier protein] reductase